MEERKHTSDIGRDYRQAHTEAQPLKVAKPERHQPAPLVAVREAYQQSCAKNADRVRRDHGQKPDILEATTEKAADNKRDKLHSTAWNLHVLRAESAEAKALDDQTCEARQCSVGNLGSCGHDEKYPGLGIFDRLDQLVALKVTVLDTLTIRSHAIDGDNAFLRIKKLGCRRKIREENESCDTGCQRGRS